MKICSHAVSSSSGVDFRTCSAGLTVLQCANIYIGRGVTIQSSEFASMPRGWTVGMLCSGKGAEEGPPALSEVKNW